MHKHSIQADRLTHQLVFIGRSDTCDNVVRYSNYGMCYITTSPSAEIKVNDIHRTRTIIMNMRL